MVARVIVDDLRTRERADGVERSARIRWDGGDLRLWVSTPRRLAGPADHAAGFLCAALLPAMRRGEDLEVRAGVSRRLLERVPRIVDLYASWDPRLHRSRVRAEERQPAPRSAAGGVGCFFSRGVDSMHSAAVPRGLPGTLTELVHCDRLEPLHSPPVRADEVRLAHEAARELGVPLVVIETNLRELTDPVGADWADMVGGGLAFLAHAMSGGFGHVVIPSSAAPTTVIPTGTSPMLDAMFSTAELEVFHDAPATRPAKVAWLARERPQLLPYLKVCFDEDRPDNCGRCQKCLLTMLALEASGALGLATAFPPEVDPAALAALDVRGLQPREEFGEVEWALRVRGDEELADQVSAALARGADAPFGGELRTDSPAFLARAERHGALVLRDAGVSRAAPATGLRGPHALPLTSVTLVASDSEEGLRKAALSVLDQTVTELELIVIGDGPDGRSAEALAGIDDPRLRVLPGARGGSAAAARNAAVAAARAPLMSHLDAATVWEPDYLAAVLACFDDPAIGLAYTNCSLIGHPTGREAYVEDPTAHPVNGFPDVSAQSRMPVPTVTMRTLAVRAVGGYAGWLRHAEDHHLYMKLARAGWRFAYVDRRLARRRWPVESPDAGLDARGRELWEHAMYASFVARHPMTPGPKRQLRVRMRRELDLARAWFLRLVS